MKRLAIATILLLGFAGLPGCGKTLTKELCGSLVKKADECKIATMQIGMKAICVEANIGKKFRDIDALEKLSKTECGEMSKAWTDYLKTAKK